MSASHLDFDLKGLQCPATWGSGAQGAHACEDALDKLCLAATPWTAVEERLKLSWSLWAHSRREEAACLLVECYMRLLPHPVFHQDCGLIRDYRRALRVVLDSTWASMRVVCVQGRRDADYLKQFIRAVEPLSSLDKKQRAAVCALRGRLSLSKPDIRTWFNKAIELSPQEGQWRYLLGWVVQEDRKCRGIPSKEEVALLTEAYRTRKNPDTVLRLARTYTDFGPKKFPQARALVDEALQLYPDHPRVLTNVANILTRLEGTGPASLRRIRDLFERAQEVIGQRAFIQMKLGSLCSQTGDQIQAQRHFALAMGLNPGSCMQFTETSLSLVS